MTLLIVAILCFVVGYFIGHSDARATADIDQLCADMDRTLEKARRQNRN